ncbi:hypothetical protein Tcan_04794 [Toxocara canis]|uniref:Uncharacterized protein n=1 Tax=Toxocara canis TaxID=6265 RepID=A0A0B2VZN6_TOXCA|nr:hypothetical protein Tcan_04794 [Toxocara canis]
MAEILEIAVIRESTEIVGTREILEMIETQGMIADAAVDLQDDVVRDLHVHHVTAIIREEMTAIAIHQDVQIGKGREDPPFI